MPTREAYAPTLTLRNPHTSPLVVKEVYSSEEFLQLDLPAGAAAAPGADAAAAAAAREKLWHLGADEAKEVVRVNFTAAVAGKYVGYVHLNTDVASMIVPVEITAVDGGVHRHPQALHFGVLSQPTELTTLPLTLSSTLDVPLLLKEMCAPSPPRDAPAAPRAAAAADAAPPLAATRSRPTRTSTSTASSRGPCCRPAARSPSRI